MDVTISNCPKCGHGVNATATACTYCGTALSSGDSSPQPGQKAPGTAAQSVRPPPLPTGDSPPVLDKTEVSAGTPEVSEVPSDPEPSSQVQPEETRIDIHEPDPKAVAGAADQLAAAGGRMDIQPPVEDPIADSDAEKTAKGQDQAPGSDAVSAEIEKPDTSSDSIVIGDLEQPATQSVAQVIPLADKAAAKSVSSDSPDLSETLVLEVRHENPAEAESPGTDVSERIADDEFELGVLLDPNASKPSDEQAAEGKIDLIQNPTPAQPDNPDGEPEASLLTADDKSQSGKPSTVAEAAKAAPAGEAEIRVESAVAATETRPSDPATAPGEARAKTEVIRKQTEALAAVEPPELETAAQKTEVIRKQTEALAAVEPPELETAAQDLADPQKKQRAARVLQMKKLAQAQALKKKRLELAQAQKRKRVAILKAQALKKQNAAQAGIVKAHKEMATGSNSPKVDKSNMIAQGRGAHTKMLGLLKKYEGQAIGINYDNSADIKEAELVKVNDEFFSVFVKDQKLNYSHPLKTILTIIEGEDGVGDGKPGQKAKFRAVIKVYPLALF